MCLLCYLNGWLVIAESRDLLLQHRELVLQLCEVLGIVINWEKSDLQPSTRVRYLGMLIGTSLESVFLSQARLAHFREVATSFIRLPSSPAHTWQQVLGHMASLECFLPSVISRIVGLLRWTTQLIISLYRKNASWRYVGGSRRTSGYLGFLFRFLPYPCRHIPTRLCQVEERICWI